MPPESSKSVREPNHSESEEGRDSIFRKFRKWVRTAFVRNAELKIVAMILALIVFVMVHNDENVVYHPWVQVTYSRESERVLVSSRVDRIQVSVRGTRRRIERLQKDKLSSLSINLERLSSGKLTLTPDMLNLPDGVELVSINPPSIDLEFDKREQKMLPVTIDVVGLPARGFKSGRVASSPSEVRVSGARKILAELNSIVTQKVNLSGRTRSFDGVVDLVKGDVDILDSEGVRVTVQIVEELERRVLAKKRVSLVPPAGAAAAGKKFGVDPTEVVVTMYGETLALEAIDADKVQVRVEFIETDRQLVGSREAELKVEPELSDIVYKIAPSKVTLNAR